MIHIHPKYKIIIRLLFILGLAILLARLLSIYLHVKMTTVLGIIAISYPILSIVDYVLGDDEEIDEYLKQFELNQ